MGRSLAETGAKVSLQVAWTVDAATAAQAQSLVAAGQKAIGMPGMGRRQLQASAIGGAGHCVVGQCAPGSADCAAPERHFPRSHLEARAPADGPPWRPSPELAHRPPAPLPSGRC